MTYREPDKADEYPVYLRGTRSELTRVEPGREHCIGRDARCEIVVVDMSIEWRHAMAVVDGAALRVWALSGESGEPLATDVDGVRLGSDVAAAVIARAGAKISLGKSTLVVEIGERVEREYDNIQRRRREMRNVQHARSWSGSLGEVPLSDLLALFQTSKKNGVLVLRNEHDVIGKIYYRKGVIYHVSIDELEAINKATARAMIMEMLGWDAGMFDFDPPSELETETVTLTGTELVLEYNARPHRDPR